jgi:hypothetical protein
MWAAAAIDNSNNDTLSSSCRPNTICANGKNSPLLRKQWVGRRGLNM